MAIASTSPTTQQGRCIEEHGDDGLWRVALRYEPEQRRTLVTEADGGEWIYEYDENRTLVAIHDPYGGRRQWVLDDEGQVVSELGPDGRTTPALPVRRRGEELWPRRSLRLLPPAARRGAQPAQPARCIAWPTRRWSSSSAARSTRVSRARQRCTSCPTPSRPSPRACGAPRLRRASLVVRCDALGREIEEIDAAGRRQAWAYDASGNVVRYIDRDGREHATEIISWNLVGAEIDPLGQRTHVRLHGARTSRAYRRPGRQRERLRVRPEGSAGARACATAWCARSTSTISADQLVEKRDGAGQRAAALVDRGQRPALRAPPGLGRGPSLRLRRARPHPRAAADAVEVRRGFTAWGRLMLRRAGRSRRAAPLRGDGLARDDVLRALHRHL